MSETKCPKCEKNFLFYVLEHRYVFSIKDVASEDIIPGEKLDAECRKSLECMSCGWQGWAEEYWEIKEGIVPLFNNPLEGKYENID